MLKVIYFLVNKYNFYRIFCKNQNIESQLDSSSSSEKTSSFLLLTISLNIIENELFLVTGIITFNKVYFSKYCDITFEDL